MKVQKLKMEKTYHLAKVPVFPVANGCPVQRDGVAKEQRVKIWKARAPSKKGVNHPPLNEDVETIEKLTNDTGTGICAVHPPEMRKGRGREKGRKREKGGEERGRNPPQLPGLKPPGSRIASRLPDLQLIFLPRIFFSVDGFHQVVHVPFFQTFPDQAGSCETGRLDRKRLLWISKGDVRTWRRKKNAHHW